MSDKDNSVPAVGSCEYYGKPFCEVKICPYEDPRKCKSRQAYYALVSSILRRENGLEREVVNG